MSPRVRVIKPVCPRCKTARYVGCYLGRWFCHNYYCTPSISPSSPEALKGEQG